MNRTMSCRGGRWMMQSMLLCAFVMGCSDDGSEQDFICTEEFAGDECTVFEMVNRERSEQGLAPLRFDVKLATSARGHAEDMIARDYFAHDSPDGENFSTRAKAAGYEGFPRAENIAYGQYAPTDVMQSWMSSDGHRKNILLEDTTALGVGKSGRHWVQVFGRD